jgi:hypothetical protein
MQIVEACAFGNHEVTKHAQSLRVLYIKMSTVETYLHGTVVQALCRL